MWIAEVYVVGVLIGLVATQGGVVSRVSLALLWPLGPLAFLMTVAGLLVVASIAYPAFGAVFATALAAAWWMAR